MKASGNEIVSGLFGFLLLGVGIAVGVIAYKWTVSHAPR